MLLCYSMFSQKYLVKRDLIAAFFKAGTEPTSYDMILEVKLDADNLYDFTLTYDGKKSDFKLKPLT